VLDWLDPEVSILKRNINGGLYTDIDLIKCDLDRLKAKLLDTGPRFTGSLEILADIQVQLVIKAADYLAIASK